ncbi:MAG: outer membrane beta-barrel protein [Pyrinomonadaceae bacterium]
MNRRQPGKWTSLMLAALLVAGLSCTNALAQSGTSAVNGTVVDPQGNLVNGATVTLSNEEKNFSRSQHTERSGAFNFTLLSPGTYRLEVEAPGFKKAVITDVRALIDKTSEMKVQLEIGERTETITVSAGSGEVLLNTQDATIGNNFVSQQITQLPLEARNPISLLTLQPGVTRAGNVTGARADQSNITLDGVDINEAQTNDINAPVLRLNAEAVEEFRVVVSNPNANQGRSSGAQISLVTKSGSNDWRGALFYAHRNTVFTANNFFANRSGLPRSALLRNTFGGAVSGPIIKDRAFFFYNYEGRRDASQALVPSRTVPLPSLGQGTVRFLGCPPGIAPANCTGANATTQSLTAAQLAGFFPAVGLNPAALSALASAASRYPANAPGGDGFNTGAFLFNAPTKVDLNSHQLRLDFNLNGDGTQQLMFRGSYQYDKQPVSFTNPQQFPDTPIRTSWYHPTGIVIGHTWTISPTKTNTFRYGLTRLAFSNLGDTPGNDIFFRFVFIPTTESYTLERINPVHNFVDDFSWIKNNHTIQIGGNFRRVSNLRTDYGAAFDTALTNPFFYQNSGNVLISPIGQTSTQPVSGAGYTILGNVDDLKAALTAVIGRFSQYTARFNFGLDGQPEQPGAPTVRNFATESYDVYAQDIWKVRHNLTLTLGLRYALSKPVYEKQGFMTTPNIPLGEYLTRRHESAAQGVNYTEPIIVNKSDHLYNWDKNDFQPRVAVAWSPSFGDNFLSRIFGKNTRSEQRSVFRGGFAITNDYFGEQLAVTFNAQNTLGFASSQVISANTYNVTNRPAPSFTGFGQDIRSLQGITVPGAVTFPQQRGASLTRIESSLDGYQVSPINYSWNFSYQRTLPKGMVFEAGYVGRSARNLLAGRDAVETNLNFTDTRSGQTWSQAASILEAARAANTAVGNIAPIAFFENVWAAGSLCAGLGICAGLTNTQAVYLYARDVLGNDWTSTQLDLEFAGGPRHFYQGQYGALAVYSTIASSDYHGATFTLRQRFKETLSYDINYTFSKSMDDVSGLQTDAPFTPFILNATDIHQARAVSDFDVRHVINANMIWQLPFGRGRTFLSGSNRIVNGIIGGWQLSSIFRWNSGLPVEAPLDFGGWPTNWNRRNYTTRIRPIEASPTRGGTTPANLFSDPTAAYQSLRSGRPGERGDRNIFRYPGYVVLDMGLAKSFTMPWQENHKLQIRWEAFNVTNTQRLTGVDGFVQGLDPQNSPAPPSFGNFLSIQGSPRVMQVGFRYSF